MSFKRLSHFLSPMIAAAALVTAISLAPWSAEAEGDVQFLNVLDDSPIEFEFRKNQEITPAVTEFHKTAVNPYNGDAEAAAAGKKIYNKVCAACHLKNGKGRIGPSLVDDDWLRRRTDTDKGKFEIIYAGGAGAMQALGRRLDQDDILKVIAYMKELHAAAN